MSVDVNAKPAAAVGRKGLRLSQEVQLVICALGIYACYLRYGLLQERIYSTAHGVDGEKYSYSLFLVAMQTATNAAVALLVLLAGRLQSRSGPEAPAQAAKEKQKQKAETGVSSTAAAKPGPLVIKGVPLGDYAVVSLAYLLAMVFSFTALNHMSYPMQALGKSSKMIPVMLMGIVIRKRRYSAREFVCVFMVSIGVALFSWKGRSAAAAGKASSPLGFLLLFASLFMDGVTGPLQERLIARYSPSTHELMFWQNFTSVLWLSIALVVTGEGRTAVHFISTYPSTLADIMTFSVVSAIGQNFIFYTVRNFNALVVTTITTTRKMFTILLSIVVYKHRVIPRQWVGLGLAFFAISWEAIAKQQAKARKKEAAAAAAASESETSKSLSEKKDE